jgi:hypothetical protein
MPVINTGIETEWGTGFKSINTWLDGNKLMHPSRYATAMPDNLMQKVASLHFQFWDANLNTLAMLPQMYFCNRPQDSLSGHFFYDYTYSVYEYNWDLPSGGNSAFVHCGTGYKDSDVPFMSLWADSVSGTSIVAPSPPEYPAQLVDNTLPVCNRDKSYASDRIYGYWVKTGQGGDNAYWSLYPYAILLFKNWTLENILNYLHGTGSKRQYQKFGWTFLKIPQYTGILTTRFVPDSEPTFQSRINLDLGMSFGLAPGFTVLDTRTYGGNAYTVVFVKGSKQIKYGYMDYGGISQPYFDIGYNSSTIPWTTGAASRNGVYIQEFGCEYWLRRDHA